MATKKTTPEKSSLAQAIEHEISWRRIGESTLDKLKAVEEFTSKANGEFKDKVVSLCLAALVQCDPAKLHNWLHGSAERFNEYHAMPKILGTNLKARWETAVSAAISDEELQALAKKMLQGAIHEYDYRSVVRNAAGRIIDNKARSEVEAVVKTVSAELQTELENQAIASLSRHYGVSEEILHAKRIEEKMAGL